MVVENVAARCTECLWGSNGVEADVDAEAHGKTARHIVHLDISAHVGSVKA